MISQRMINPNDRLIELAFLEDLGNGDITTSLIVPSEKVVTAQFIAKEELVLAGIPFARRVFSFLSDSIEIETLKREGETLQSGDVIARVRGGAAHILAGERTALNILQRVSGIASVAKRFVDLVNGLTVRIVDTRKTAPGMRLMDKYGVLMGGAYNHRFGLFDGILIKDNHIKIAGSITAAVRSARKAHHLLKIEVETSDMDGVREALEAGADVIMLDNMTINEMAEAVRFINKRVLTEASGNVTIDNVRSIAGTGVDLISVGALTHSARAVDISMKIL